MGGKRKTTKTAAEHQAAENQAAENQAIADQAITGSLVEALGKITGDNQTKALGAKRKTAAQAKLKKTNRRAGP